MLARATTFTLEGLEPRRVMVEVDVRPGLPAFGIVGLGDVAVREARERVRAALPNAGFVFPLRRVIANVAPAHLPKAGAGFDLALALAVLAATGQLPARALEDWAVLGELSLSGRIRPCRGALAVAEGVRRAGMVGLIVERGQAAEAALVDGIRVAGVGRLEEVVALLRGEAEAPAPPACAPRPAPADEPDLADVRGQAGAICALEIAAAGGHNLLLEGAPGTGKTMLARRLPSILPPLSREEALEVTRIHSIAGLQPTGRLLTRRPFRAPHHTISSAGLIGGGSLPQPGEASLAHHGVLFLDELSEFPRSSLEALRQPLEDGRAVVVRGQHTAVFPTRFMLVAATNPCPCGYAGVADRECTCAEAELARYRRRLSGPLLDRLDLLVTVTRPSAPELGAKPVTSSSAVRDRVIAARERQEYRLRGTHASCNGQLDARLARRLLRLSDDAGRVLGRAYDRDRLSARAHHRILRVARTAADLEGSADVRAGHVLLALALRQRAAAAMAA